MTLREAIDYVKRQLDLPHHKEAIEALEKAERALWAAHLVYLAAAPRVKFPDGKTCHIVPEKQLYLLRDALVDLDGGGDDQT